MNNKMLGYHHAWNTAGFPKGLVWQSIVQEMGKEFWGYVQKKSSVTIDLDFEDSVINPLNNVIELFRKIQKKNFPNKKLFIAILSDQQTSDSLPQETLLVDYINTLPDSGAVLIEPTELTLKDSFVCFNDQVVTLIISSLNSQAIINAGQKNNIEGFLFAMRKGWVINPIGIEPLSYKGVFEAITTQYKSILSQTTVRTTPWTRRLSNQKTSGPNNENIESLINLINSSPKDFVVTDIKSSWLPTALDTTGQIEKKSPQELQDLIVQSKKQLQANVETFPVINFENRKLTTEQQQLVFNHIISDATLSGVSIIPKNTPPMEFNSMAILRSNIPVKTAVERINRIILDLDFDFVDGILAELTSKHLTVLGNNADYKKIHYLLAPKIVSQNYVNQLKEYSKNLWYDALLLENLYTQSGLDKYIRVSTEQKTLIKSMPWQRNPAILQIEGSFNISEDNLWS